MGTAVTTITVRTDAETKRKAKELFAGFGMDMSTAINAFLHQSVTERAIPFRIWKGDVPNDETLEAINDPETYGPFDTVEELMEALDADD
ncbi:type II toxin-antitoxin system RelB/DinJ family antitoxin [Candidatus Saccharibacteria bacterium]|nr:type II toxin-antitoxin system RelB/DinJ family antitoxin [Candidatus Saccharibacteria bacterium]